MTRSILVAGALAIAFTAAAHAQSPTTPVEPRTSFTAGGSAGYANGFGVEFYGMFSNFARGLPMSARVALGYTSLDPGSAGDARRIFINNATNGEPDKSGRTLEMRFDAMFRMTSESATPAYIYIGPRYSSFRGNFRFIGGNEDFDVTSGQWGLGTGLEGHFGMGRSGALIIGGGVDYFFEGALTGHDTTYTPSGDDINPRKRYTFVDADAAINQPRWVPRFMVGFNYTF